MYLGNRFQRGRGIGSLFGTVFRSILPIGKRILQSNVTKTLGKTVGKTLKDAAIETAADLLEGKTIKESAKKQLETTKRKIAKAIKSDTRQVSHKRRKRNKIDKKLIRNRGNYFLLK